MTLPQFPKKLVNNASLVIIGLAVLLLVTGFSLFIQQQANRDAIKQQTTSTNQLIRQVRDISEENRKLNEQNRNYAYCTALLVAQYSQNEAPIVIKDLDKCVTDSFSFDSTNPAQVGPTVTVETLNDDGTVSEKDVPVSQVQPQQIIVTTPTQTPAAPQNPTSQNVQPTLSVPGLLNLNTPCISVLRLVNTCSQ